MKLTAENYFSIEAQKEYMSVSQIKAFRKCEAGALAEINGEYHSETTTPMLIGSFVDAYFEGTIDLFKRDNPQIFTRNGDLKSEYKHAEYIIERISRDKLFMKCMSGDKQIIKTGTINNVPFKIKIDSLHQDKIVDLKVMKDFKPIWVDELGKVNFVEAWGYDLQGAIYQKIEGNKLPFYIAAATKEKEPDIAIIHIEQKHLDIAYKLVSDDIIRYDMIKKGIVEPDRCEKCDYCRKTKVLNKVITLEDLEYES